MWIRAAIVGVVALGVLGGCAARVDGVDNPLTRKFQWFSYLQGDDFKGSCGPGAAARYRMVLNAIYTEQVRIYNVSDGVMDVRLVLPMDMRDFALTSSPASIFDPWRGMRSGVDLGTDGQAELVAALQESGVFGPPNQGAELSSRGFFWTIAACHQGQYHFTGFQWPSDEWMAATFPQRLFDLDPTSVAVNPPRKTKTSRQHLIRRGNVDIDVNEYHLKVGEDGLVGIAPFL